MDKVNLFVYGTLKRGGRLHPHITAAKGEFLGERTLHGFRMFNMGWFPALQKTDDKKDVIYGEQYQITEHELKHRFDPVEGYPSLYDRTETEFGWVYFMPGDRATHGKLIEDGNFKVK